jgi:hypothetical protein
MKPGTLVILVGGTEVHVPKGSCGEIKDAGPFKHEIPVGRVAVDFPYHPSGTSTNLWCVPLTWLIPLNDPDADISDKTSEDFDVTMDKPIVETI